MRLAPALCVAALAAACAPALAQYSYFGKNKVQTRDYAFKSFETEHFKVLFYPGGEVVAEFAAKSAEDYYRLTSGDMGYDLDEKVPLILYLSPGQFSETNVTTDIIEEGVGGFSELIKNRIVIPFDGSYNDLHHVIGHELTHIFEFQLFYKSRMAALLGAVTEFQIPLWVMEGFAEYQSGWVNVGSDQFMRDLVINNRLVPLSRLSDDLGYLVYREGESFFQYVAGRYGPKKVYEFLHVLNNKRGMDAAFDATFGESVDKVSGEWEKALRARYWPQVVRQDNFDRLCEKLTDHVQDGSIYNTAPAISPSGTKVALISDRLEYTDVYVVSASDGRVIKRLVKGERSGGFENMHLIRPGVAWSPDESEVAVVTTSAGRDNVALIDYARGRVVRRISGNIDAIYSPKFSPDGRRIAFVGVKNGFSDIYAVPAAGGEPVRLTYDIYDDRDPAFSPSGESIAFVSDRPDEGGEWVPGAYAVWLRDAAGALKRLTGRGSEVMHPEFTHSGEYLLYAALDSATDLCVLSLATGRVVRRTDFLGNASYPTLSRDDRKLCFAYYSDVGWDAAVMLDPLERLPADSSAALSSSDTATFTKAGLDFDRVKPVGFSLSLDYAIGEASYATGSYGGLSGTIELAFSDIMGDHEFDLYTDLYGDILNSDLLFEYWLLPYRVDYGLALFQYREFPYVSYTDQGLYELVQRINRGGQAMAVYPFNKFLRAELGLTGYVSDTVYARWYSPDENPIELPGTAFVSYLSPAFVTDNTYWDANGPARGTRARLGADVALVTARGRRFEDAYLDFRNYQRLGRRFVFATRLYGTTGLGSGADRYYIGGELVRGYDYSEFYNDTGPSLGLFNLELRYPFIDRLKLAFPLPIELGGIRGVAFCDGGFVFRNGASVWDSTASRLQDLKVGVGVGLRFSISSIPLQLDFGKPLSATEDKSWKFYFGIGTDY